ncbi:FAD-dependent oxidoreductase [Marinimicrobium sp. C6131]|uniref:FAD-dependent oxidoreductase n=1 Tax=Marinimicrobium sp. C6131 TaxID=3022676 RepID=UPI00223DBA16|nr:FAD-dependent oxidoreductase [Marinimicrobium sp. C6131]UZJ43244.1 FAD-dependent oxidoreductase [Marinimicrobium sp. C6131]
MRTLLLAGGGLTHALYLANARHLLPDDVRVVLLSPERFVPFSGMLPGLIAGRLRFRDCHIDLGQLCRATHTELLFGRLASLDPEQRQARLDNGDLVDFDLLSINTGLQAVDTIPGLAEYGMSTRPISGFLPRWQETLARLCARDRNNPANLGIIGGNLEGVEMALAIRQRLRREESLKAPVSVHLIHGGGKLLPEFPLAAQLRAAQLLQEREIRVHPLFDVARVDREQIYTDRHQHLPMDAVIGCVSGQPGAWVSTSGLALTDRGRIQVNSHLQAVSHPFVFAAGAVASVAGGPGPGGVTDLALRQAPVLAANLARALAGEPLRRYRPGRRTLSIITTSDDYALARYGNHVWGGRWVERWKYRRDRKVMANFPRV